VRSTTPLFVIGSPESSIPSMFKFPIEMLEQLTYMVAIMTCLFLCSSAPLDRGQSTIFIYPLYSRIECRRSFDSFPVLSEFSSSIDDWYIFNISVSAMVV
jgi:hypothetical protein